MRERARARLGLGVQLDRWVERASAIGEARRLQLRLELGAPLAQRQLAGRTRRRLRRYGPDDGEQPFPAPSGQFGLEALVKKAGDGGTPLAILTAIPGAARSAAWPGKPT